MEPAKIDWKKLEWKFVEDDRFEHMNAPKWFDFLSAQDHSVDDEAWFCRPDCNHPKTAEDFLKLTPSKLTGTADVSEIPPLGDRNQRDARLKRRGLTPSWISPNSNSKFNKDGENQNPNLSTPPLPISQAKIIKAAIKSSAEKKERIDEASQNNGALPRLKSTLSARNLFAGRDILNQITEFCNELKRMATRAKEKEKEDMLNVTRSAEKVKENVAKEEKRCPVLGELDWKGKERKPLLFDGVVEKPKEMEKSSVKEKPRKKRTDDAENISPISLNIENVKQKGENLLQIRTNPPSPQCFSATRAPGKTTPSKGSKSRLMERGVLQEQNKQVVLVAKEEESMEKTKCVSSIVDTREARTLDVFWFLKPCTLSTDNV
ncbi:hypothetical protein UlMin_007184 [Ulmus minor]